MVTNARPSPLIQSLDIRSAGRQQFHAVLHLPSSPDNAQFEALTALLDYGQTVYQPSFHNGQPVLKVDGIFNPDAFVQDLHRGGFIATQNAAEYARKRETETAEEQKPEGLRNRIKHFIGRRTLRAASLFYMFGDLCGMAIGLINKDRGDLTWGVSTITASAQMGLFGDRQTHHNLAERLTDDMAEHVSRHGDMDYVGNIRDTLPQSALESADRFMGNHAVYINNALFSRAIKFIYNSLY